MRERVYLGDGVYASYDGYMLSLTANEHTGNERSIYLEPSVYASLVAFMERMRQEEQGD